MSATKRRKQALTGLASQPASAEMEVIDRAWGKRWETVRAQAIQRRGARERTDRRTSTRQSQAADFRHMRTAQLVSFASGNLVQLARLAMLFSYYPAASQFQKAGVIAPSSPSLRTAALSDAAHLPRSTLYLCSTQPTILSACVSCSSVSFAGRPPDESARWPPWQACRAFSPPCFMRTRLSNGVPLVTCIL